MMNEQAEVRSMSVEDGNITLVVEDVSKPIWYGDYHNGKLAIYHADITGLPVADAIGIVTVFTDVDNNDFVAKGVFESNLGIEEIVSSVCAGVIIEYEKKKAKNTVPFYVPGPSTLQ